MQIAPTAQGGGQPGLLLDGWMGGGDGSGRLAYEVTAMALELFPGVSFATLD